MTTDEMIHDLEARVIPKIFNQKLTSSFWDDADEEVPSVFINRMPIGYVGCIASQPGLGKTFIAEVLAISRATGKRLIDGFTPNGRGKVLCIFSEEFKTFASRRLRSICRQYGLDRSEIESLIDDGTIDIRYGISRPLTRFDKNEAFRTEAHDELMELCQREQFSLIVIDPWVAFSGCSLENENTQSHHAVMAAAELATASNAFTLILHHTNKDSDRAGEASLSSLRGGSGFGGVIRWCGILTGFSPKDCEYFGIPSNQRGQFIKFNEVKNQHFRLDGNTITLEKDAEGVPKSVELASEKKHQLLDAIIQELEASNLRLSVSEIKRKEGELAIRFRAGVDKRINRKATSKEVKSAIEEGIFYERLGTQEIRKTSTGLAKKVLVSISEVVITENTAA